MASYPSSVDRDAIGTLCRTYGVAELYLFGSHADGTATDGSDVDILVSFSGRNDLFNRYMGLLEDLRRLFQGPVDLVMADSIRNPVFRAEVMDHRQLMYVA